MSTERRFARLGAGTPLPPGASMVPDGGMCLSVFLVLRSPGNSQQVLMGRLNPTADWWEKGGVDPGRIERIGRKWMLPSRQLVFFEGIDEAARVICREQLGSELPAVTGPSVFSDPSDRPGPGARDPHWDIHFVFDGRWTTKTPPSNPMWHELAFVEVPKTPRAEIARGQADVLELIGIRPLE